MTTTDPASSIILIGVGGSGSVIARNTARAYGRPMRFLMLDTDAVTGQYGEEFILIGGEKLAGHGAGGSIVQARMASEGAMGAVDEHLRGVRLAVIVTSLGGGTGGGTTLELARRLRDLGIRSVLFATMPFTMEGPDRTRTAEGIRPMLADMVNSCFCIPLDTLVGTDSPMAEAMRQGQDRLATALTMFWRLVASPGYLRIDTERLGHLISRGGEGHLAMSVKSGPCRTQDMIDEITDSPLLAGTSRTSVRSIFIGVLGGEDMRLAEISRLAEAVRSQYPADARFELATVNDDTVFSGRLGAVVMLFEENGGGDVEIGTVMSGRGRKPRPRDPLAVGPVGRGRFNNVTPTMWDGEDLDLPTFLRKEITLDI